MGKKKKLFGWLPWWRKCKTPKESEIDDRNATKNSTLSLKVEKKEKKEKKDTTSLPDIFRAVVNGKKSEQKRQDENLGVRTLQKEASRSLHSDDEIQESFSNVKQIENVSKKNSSSILSSEIRSINMVKKDKASKNPKYENTKKQKTKVVNKEVSSKGMQKVKVSTSSSSSLDDGVAQSSVKINAPNQEKLLKTPKDGLIVAEYKQHSNTKLESPKKKKSHKKKSTKSHILTEKSPGHVDDDSRRRRRSFSTDSGWRNKKVKTRSVAVQVNLIPEVLQESKVTQNVPASMVSVPITLKTKNSSSSDTSIDKPSNTCKVPQQKYENILISNPIHTNINASYQLYDNKHSSLINVDTVKKSHRSSSSSSSSDVFLETINSENNIPHSIETIVGKLDLEDAIKNISFESPVMKAESNSETHFVGLEHIKKDLSLESIKNNHKNSIYDSPFPVTSQTELKAGKISSSDSDSSLHVKDFTFSKTKTNRIDSYEDLLNASAVENLNQISDPKVSSTKSSDNRLSMTSSSESEGENKINKNHSTKFEKVPAIHNKIKKPNLSTSSTSYNSSENLKLEQNFKEGKTKKEDSTPKTSVRYASYEYIPSVETEINTEQERLNAIAQPVDASLNVKVECKTEIVSSTAKGSLPSQRGSLGSDYFTIKPYNVAKKDYLDSSSSDTSDENKKSFRSKAREFSDDLQKRMKLKFDSTSKKVATKKENKNYGTAISNEIVLSDSSLQKLQHDASKSNSLFYVCVDSPQKSRSDSSSSTDNLNNHNVHATLTNTDEKNSDKLKKYDTTPEQTIVTSKTAVVKMSNIIFPEHTNLGVQRNSISDSSSVDSQIFDNPTCDFTIAKQSSSSSSSLASTNQEVEFIKIVTMPKTPDYTVDNATNIIHGPSLITQSTETTFHVQEIVPSFHVGHPEIIMSQLKFDQKTTTNVKTHSSSSSDSSISSPKQGVRSKTSKFTKDIKNKFKIKPKEYRQAVTTGEKNDRKIETKTELPYVHENRKNISESMSSLEESLSLSNLSVEDDKDSDIELKLGIQSSPVVIATPKSSKFSDVFTHMKRKNKNKLERKSSSESTIHSDNSKQTLKKKAQKLSDDIQLKFKRKPKTDVKVNEKITFPQKPMDLTEKDISRQDSKSSVSSIEHTAPPSSLNTTISVSQKESVRSKEKIKAKVLKPFKTRENKDLKLNKSNSQSSLHSNSSDQSLRSHTKGIIKELKSKLKGKPKEPLVSSPVLQKKTIKSSQELKTPVEEIHSIKSSSSSDSSGTSIKSLTKNVVERRDQLNMSFKEKVDYFENKVISVIDTSEHDSDQGQSKQKPKIRTPKNKGKSLQKSSSSDIIKKELLSELDKQHAQEVFAKISLQKEQSEHSSSSSEDDLPFTDSLNTEKNYDNILVQASLNPSASNEHVFVVKKDLPRSEVTKSTISISSTSSEECKKLSYHDEAPIKKLPALVIQQDSNHEIVSPVPTPRMRTKFSFPQNFEKFTDILAKKSSSSSGDDDFQSSSSLIIVKEPKINNISTSQIIANIDQSHTSAVVMRPKLTKMVRMSSNSSISSKGSVDEDKLRTQSSTDSKRDSLSVDDAVASVIQLYRPSYTSTPKSSLPIVHSFKKNIVLQRPVKSAENLQLKKTTINTDPANTNKFEIQTRDMVVVKSIVFESQLNSAKSSNSEETKIINKENSKINSPTIPKEEDQVFTVHTSKLTVKTKRSSSRSSSSSSSSSSDEDQAKLQKPRKNNYEEQEASIYFSDNNVYDC